MEVFEIVCSVTEGLTKAARLSVSVEVSDELLPPVMVELNWSDMGPSDNGFSLLDDSEPGSTSGSVLAVAGPVQSLVFNDGDNE